MSTKKQRIAGDGGRVVHMLGCEAQRGGGRERVRRGVTDGRGGLRAQGHQGAYFVGMKEVLWE